MRELRSCDFCADEAVGTFEIVPPALEPTETEQRRVVCCPDCKARLESLLEPLLARLTDDDHGEDRARSRDVTESEGGDGMEPVDAATDEPSQPRLDADDSTDSADPGSAGTADTAAESEGSGDTESDPRGDAESEVGSDSGSLLEEGITFEHDGRADDAAVDSAEVAELVDATTTEATAEAETAEESADAAASETTPNAEAAVDAADAAASETTSETETGSDSSAAVADEPTDSDGESTDVPKRPPKRYNKVIRLLRNRQFPMQRSAVEELAAGAYDLESDEVATIIDYAIENDEFEQKREMLHRA